MNGPHLDDELLSASLDGAADAAAAGHLAGCAACRARLDAFDAVRARVASGPPGAPAGLADGAVAAATRAWREERGDGVVVPLRPPARGRRVPGWALGAAAAAAAFLLAVPLVTDDADRTEQTASGKVADTADDAGAVELLDRSAVSGGDLGDLSDPSALKQELDRAVAAAGAGGPAVGAPEAAAGAGDRTEDATGETRAAAPRAAPAPAAPATGFTDGDDDEAAADRAAPATTGQVQSGTATPCRAEVRSTYGRGLGPLLYTASLRWQGTPAVLLAYRLVDTSGPGPDHRAFVMAPEGCRLLVVQAF